MKWSVMIVAAALFALTSVSGWAGEKCCGSEKAKAKKADISECRSVLSGLDLTAEQQAKVDEIQAACKAAGETKDACKNAFKEIRSVLTDDQIAQFDAKCGKNAKRSSGCE